MCIRDSLKASRNAEDRFAWFGKLDERDLEFVQVLMEDLTNSNVQDRFLISDAMDQFSAGLNSADVVLLTQRPGCKRSFVADALATKAPIVWFTGDPQKEVHLGEDDPLRSSDAQAAAANIASLFSDGAMRSEAASKNRRRAEKLDSVDRLVYRLSDQLQLALVQDSLDGSKQTNQNGAAILPFLRAKDRRRVVFATPTWQISGVNTVSYTHLTLPTNREV